MADKTIMMGLVAIAFVAGSIMTGTMAEAKKDKEPKENPFDAIWDAIAGLQAQIDDIELTSGQDGTDGLPGQDGTDGLPGQDGTDGTGIVNGFYTKYFDRRILPPTGGSAISVYADCEAGDKAISGLLQNMKKGLLIINQSIGNGASQDNRWNYEIMNPTNGELSVQAGVVCADITP